MSTHIELIDDRSKFGLISYNKFGPNEINRINQNAFKNDFWIKNFDIFLNGPMHHFSEMISQLNQPLSKNFREFRTEINHLLLFIGHRNKIMQNDIIDDEQISWMFFNTSTIEFNQLFYYHWGPNCFRATVHLCILQHSPLSRQKSHSSVMIKLDERPRMVFQSYWIAIG